MRAGTRRLLVAAGSLLLVGLVITALYLATQTSVRARSLPQTEIPKLQLPGDQTLVFYYFHGNVRCTTCRTIEEYTQRVVQQAFGDQLAMGRVQLKMVNVDEPLNQHYIEDYQLVFRSVVVSMQQGQRQVAWRRLDGVWSEVRDWPSFSRYLLAEVSRFVEEGA